MTNSEIRRQERDRIVAIIDDAVKTAHQNSVKVAGRHLIDYLTKYDTNREG